jgi:branched-chain amino acid transport system substrate-binding protein
MDYVITNLGHKRCYILAADYNYGHITSKWMQKFIRERGGEDLGVEFFPLDVNNFQPAISRIQSAKPDIVLSALVGGAHIAFYRQFESTIGKDTIALASGS